MPLSTPLCLAFVAVLAPLVAAQSFFPCHPSKPTYNYDATCSRVVMPSGLCKRCPLRETRPDGRFEDCSRIYNTEGDDCHAALMEYVEENGHCDPVRKDAIPKMIAGDGDMRMVVDYFLYSVCEQCCDCIPMGAEPTDYSKLAAAGALWKEDRGNCPAHAHFDVCKVLPHVTYFTTPGGPEQQAEKACPMLRDWHQSDEASEWQTNPQTNLKPELAEFLRGLLKATECGNNDIWMRCYEMEDRQNHLELPPGYEEPTDAPTTSVPTTTTTEATSATVTEPTSSTETGPATTSAATTTETSTFTSTATVSTTASDTASEATAASATTTTATASTNVPTTAATETNGDTTPSTVIESDPNTNTEGTTTTSDDTSTIGSDIPPTPAAPEDSGEPTDDPNGISGPETIDGGAENNSSGEDGEGSEESDSTATCFPASAEVELADGKVVRMEQLRIGDTVRVSSNTFSEVFLFSHRTGSTSAPFYVQLSTSNSTLTVTSGHYLHVNDQLTRAELVRPGDRILTADNGWMIVADVRKVGGKGLYNPHTVHGDIVVDGFVASTFTAAVPARVATGMLAPLRALYAKGFVTESRFGQFLAHGWQSVLPSSLEL